MPELNFKITGDDSDLKKTLADVAKMQKETNAQVAKDIATGVEVEKKERDKIVKVTKEQKEASRGVVDAVNEEAKAHDRATQAIKRKKIAVDEIRNTQIQPSQVLYTPQDSKIAAENAPAKGGLPVGAAAAINQAQYEGAAKAAEYYGAAASSANTTAASTARTATRANDDNRRAIDSLKIALQSYKNIAGSATNPAILAEYNNKVRETTAQIQRLNNVGKKGFDELGNRIKSTIGAQEILNNKLRFFQDALSRAKAPQSFVTLNQKIEETKAALDRLNNAGKKGFDELGNKIIKTDSEVGKLLNTIKSIGAAILAAFSVQMITSWVKEARTLAANGEGIRDAFSKLGNEKTLDKLRIATRGAVTDVDLMAKALQAKNFKIGPELLAKGLELAGKVSRQTGVDVNYLADSFVTGLGRNSLKILDNLQISQVQLRKEINRTGSVQIAVGNIVDEKLKEMGEVAETSADRMAKWATKIANIKEKVGQKINFIFNYDSLKEATKDFYETGLSVQNLQKNISPLLTKFDDLSAKAAKNGGITKLTKIEQALMKDIIKQVGDEIPSAITQFDKYGNAMSISTDRAKEFIKQQVLVMQALNEVRIQETTKKLGELNKELTAVQALMDESAKTGSIKIYENSNAGSGGGGVAPTIRKATQAEVAALVARGKSLAAQIEKNNALLNADSGTLLTNRQAEIDKNNIIKPINDDSKDQKEADKLRKARERQDAADASALSAQENLQQRIQVLKDKFARQGFTKEQEARQAIIDEFKKLAFDIEQQAKKYDAYAKKYGVKRANEILGPKQTTEQIEPVRKAAIDDLTYRQETAQLEIQLIKQRDLYESFEMWKRNFGEESAKKRFGDELDVSTTYLDKLKENYSKLLLKSAVSTITNSPLTGGEQEKLLAGGKLLEEAQKSIKNKQDQDYASAFKAAEDLAQMELAIKKDYSIQLDALLNKQNGKISDEQRRNLELSRDAGINSAREEVLAKSEVFRKYSEEALILTREQIRKQIETMRSLLKDPSISADLKKSVETQLGGLEGRLNLGANKSNIQELNKEKGTVIEKISKREQLKISTPEDTAALKGLYQRLLEIQNLTDKLNAKGLKGFMKTLNENKTLSGVATGLGLASDAAMTLSQGLGGVDTEAGYTLDTIGQLAGAAGDLAGAIVSGDPAKMIGAAVKAVGTLFSIGKKVREMNLAAKKEVEDFYINAIKGEREYQDLLKERQLETIRNNKIALQGIRDEINLRKSQTVDYSKEANEIMGKLQGQSFVASETYKHGTWFRKAKVNKTYGSLNGKSFQELSQLLAQGKLEGDAKALVERLKELEQKGYDAEKAMADLAKETSELFTGTSADNLTNSLLDMFKRGETGATDLADFFKASMDDAALSIFKNKVLAGAMETFYNEFDKAAQSGEELTADELAKLNGLFTSLTGDALKKFEDYKKITGSDLSGSSNKTGVSGAIVGEALKEDTANKAMGIWRGNYDLTKELVFISKESNASLKQLGLTAIDQLNIAKSNLDVALRIDSNTFRTANNTDGIAGQLDKIIKNTSGDSLDQSLRNGGIKL
ncbi:hypothetical protein [Pedobacter gandavensis]|uniref:Phage tail tape measure protein n=1 Tax=Pedobacter gandavensis TaxID=2679963 RepID=A0ABR6EU37_9SPHI|nr:hypothetical protein [Pedobacter gandavensis]MBB2148785.1 hypothetical protein [Pedobacter gandavensis]